MVRKRKKSRNFGGGIATAIGGVVLGVSLCAAGADYAVLEGRARVKDGDSVLVGKVEIRLLGLDAVEHKQKCIGEDGRWKCGLAATGAMRKIAQGARVRCSIHARDVYDRYLAVCVRSDDGEDIAAALVRAGWAVALGKRYRADAEFARGRKLGIWEGCFTKPSKWRKGKRACGVAGE